MERQEFNEIKWGDHEDYVTVTGEVIEEQSRWSVYKSCVLKQVSTGKFFEAYWGEGATEYQEGQDEDWSLTEVEPFEVTVTKYKSISGGIRHES